MTRQRLVENRCRSAGQTRSLSEGSGPEVVPQETRNAADEALWIVEYAELASTVIQS